MLEGTSIKENQHLARFARAPYLRKIIDDPNCDGMMRRQGKALRKELTEAYGLLGAIEAVVGTARPACVIDLCSGKGFQSLIVAHEYAGLVEGESRSVGPSTAPCDVVMIDNHKALKMDHVASLPNLRFFNADIFSPSFELQLSSLLPPPGVKLSSPTRVPCRVKSSQDGRNMVW